MRTHPFEPQIPKNTKKLLIGTLPPEGVPFYFSNSSNTRLWDILSAINESADHVGLGGNRLSDQEKIKILANLNIGITDIIYRYERDEQSSPKDIHINPIEYKGILRLVIDHNIEELLFVYESALKWFMHSLENINPTRLINIPAKYNVGKQRDIVADEKSIKCTLLPSPLNRGRKGETINYKLSMYKNHIG